MQVSFLDINHPVANSLWNGISIYQLTLLLAFWTDASKPLLFSFFFFLLKSDYNVVTNLSRLDFSTGVGWCLFWLASHCIIYAVHASSWQNSQLNQNNSPDVCHNLLCTLYLVSTAHSFSPHTPQCHLCLISITNLKIQYLLFLKALVLETFHLLASCREWLSWKAQQRCLVACFAYWKFSVTNIRKSLWLPSHP